MPRSTGSLLEKTCSITLSSSIGALQEIRLTLIADVRKQQTPSEAYIRCCIDGWPIVDTQTVHIRLGGRELAFRANCHPSLGWVNKDTVVVVGNNSGHEVNGVNDIPSKGFRAIGGLDGVVKQILATVKKPFTDADIYKRSGLKPPRGILLYGPPGTGKTLLARCLSEELPETYVKAVKATELTGNDADSRIHETFRISTYEAKNRGKTSLLIFIDEIDALCPSRESTSSESDRRAVAALLTEMDGFSEIQGFPTVILAATNRPNSIDIALRRPGRFECEIEIPPPDAEGRIKILRIMSHNTFARVWRPADVELHEISSFTHGFVGADLLSLLNKAAFHSIDCHKDWITMDDIRFALNHVTPSALRELSISVPKTKWSDIGGYDDVKSHLIEAVIWPISHAKAFKTMRVDAPKGVLLYGPPGCSKTMMARAAATESSMNFIAVKGPEVFSKWVGESEQAIRSIFQKARQASPCIIFFDEIDALGTQRDSSGDGGVGSRVLTQLLTEMDGLSIHKQVIIIAATNRPYSLDPALLRPGRFDRLVYVGLPDSGARASIWANTLRMIPNNLQQWDEHYISQLSDISDGYSGAEIVMIVKEAAINCIKRSIGSTGDDNIVGLTTELEKMSLSPRGGLTLEHEDIARVITNMLPRTDKALLRKLQDFEKQSNSIP